MPSVIVGNKMDIWNASTPRPVSIEDGKALAVKNQCPYVETSATQKYNLQEALVLLMREIAIAGQLREKEEKEEKKEKKEEKKKEKKKSEEESSEC